MPIFYVMMIKLEGHLITCLDVVCRIDVIVFLCCC